MSDSVSRRFMDCLLAAERTRDVEPLVALFTEQSVLSRAPSREPRSGIAGARRFWTEYLDAVKNVRTRFTQVTEQGARSVLEWTSEGELPSGAALDYDGVSIVEFEGERVKAFRSYYDSAVFGLHEAVKKTQHVSPGESPIAGESHVTDAT